MEFTFLNLFNAAVIVLIMIPNIVWFAKHKNGGIRSDNRAVNVIEQTARYICMILMILPLFIGKFGFKSVADMIICFVGCIVLVLLYWTAWVFFARKPSSRNRLALAAIPVAIFLLCALEYRYPALAVSAVIFGAAHIYITVCHNAKSKGEG